MEISMTVRVILWTRATPPVAKAAVVADYVIAVDPALSNVLYRGRTKTNASRDYTVKVDADRQQAGTTYCYQFKSEGASAVVGRTKTLPAGTASHLRVAVVSCSNFAYGYFNAYRRIAERADLDLVMHLGDHLYEYQPARDRVHAVLKGGAGLWQRSGGPRLAG
jgi:alkaline phosphatase D